MYFFFPREQDYLTEHDLYNKLLEKKQISVFWNIRIQNDRLHLKQPFPN